MLSGKVRTIYDPFSSVLDPATGQGCPDRRLPAT